MKAGSPNNPKQSESKQPRNATTARPLNNSWPPARPKMARGRPTSPLRLLSSPERLSATAIEDRVKAKLSRLDGEQLQIVEIVIAALVRGA
jgi:hypothetical protein